MTENTGNIGSEETLSEAINKFESKFNVPIEEERDEYEAQKYFWVPNKVNSLC